ncbi:glutamate mutase L [Chloroflexota bacterium]
MVRERTAVESILAIDSGCTMTRAFLMGQVDGVYRLLARSEVPSTLESPWRDMMAAVRQALDRISGMTDWRLLDDQGRILSPQSEWMGVDAVVAITSASKPLRLVLTGVTHTLSLASARRALPTPYALVEGVVSSDKRGGTPGSEGFEDQVCLLQDLAPDAIVIVGGVDGGASEPVLQATRAVAWAYSSLASLQGVRPSVIYAGNSELQGRVANLLESCADLRVVDNVRPSVDLESLGPLWGAVEELHRQHKMEQLPGFGSLLAWTSAPVLPTAWAFAHTIRYLAGLEGTNVLGVDIGGATTTVATVVDGHLDLTVRNDLGLGGNVARVLDHVPIESVSRWLPLEAGPAEVHNAIYNKAVHCHSLPQTSRDLWLEQAVAREILRLTLTGSHSYWPDNDGECPVIDSRLDLIVGSGGVLAAAPNHGQAALVLLDALQPVGISRLALDKAGLVAPLGAVATLDPQAAAQLMERDALLELGTVVAPVGNAREGEVALNVKIDYEGGPSLEAEVEYGSLEVIPLPPGQTADLELRPARHFEVDLGTKGQVGRTRVEGGSLGVIIDARGRPLAAAEDPEEQREKVRRWLWALES